VEDPEIVDGPTPGYRQPVNFKKFIDHCHNEMSEKIKESEVEGGPLSGNSIFELSIDISHFEGCITLEEMNAAFKTKAGMDDPITVRENYTGFDGYEHAIDNNDEIHDDPEEEQNDRQAFDSDDESKDSNDE
jgi:hypothetical protein